MTRADQADKRRREELWKKQDELGVALLALAEHSNSRLSLSQWTKKCTSWDKGSGVSDFRMVGYDRAEKSLEDARWWLSELEKGRVV